MRTYVLCEDDEEQLKNLYDYVDRMTTNKEIISFQSGSELLANLDSLQDGAIFLMDIVLNEITGIDVARIINHTLHHCAIIFISAYLEKATDVYDTPHCYFVYKPELRKRLPVAIKCAEDMMDESKTLLQIKTKGGIVLLHIADICYIERVKRTTMIHCQNECYLCAHNLQYFVESLGKNFLKCHCSYIVNMNMVKEYQRTEFHLRTGMVIPISRAFSNITKKNFQEYIMYHGNQM